MMTQTATVINYQNGYATVECLVNKGCIGCSAKSGCGTASLSELTLNKRSHILSLKSDTPLEKGDIVEIGISEKTIFLSLLLMYAIPLLVLLTSAILGTLFLTNELVILSGVITATYLAFRLVRYISLKLQHNQAYQIKLLHKQPENLCQG